MIAVAAWLVVAVVVAALIGRTVRQRDRQVPREAAPGHANGVRRRSPEPLRAEARAEDPRQPGRR